MKSFKYICKKCGEGIYKKLCEDNPSVHTYIWACHKCGTEYGEEWVERHHGPGENPPDLDLPLWIDKGK
jgi:hypothetical protein